MVIQLIELKSMNEKHNLRRFLKSAKAFRAFSVLLFKTSCTGDSGIKNKIPIVRIVMPVEIWLTSLKFICRWELKWLIYWLFVEIRLNLLGWDNQGNKKPARQSRQRKAWKELTFVLLAMGGKLPRRTFELALLSFQWQCPLKLFRSSTRYKTIVRRIVWRTR